MTKDELIKLIEKVSNGTFILVFDNGNGDTEYLAGGNPKDNLALATFAHRLACMRFDDSYREGSSNFSNSEPIHN